jgi:hypothetical protein
MAVREGTSMFGAGQFAPFGPTGNAAFRRDVHEDKTRRQPMIVRSKLTSGAMLTLNKSKRTANATPPHDS